MSCGRIIQSLYHNLVRGKQVNTLCSMENKNQNKSCRFRLTVTYFRFIVTSYKHFTVSELQHNTNKDFNRVYI